MREFRLAEWESGIVDLTPLPDFALSSVMERWLEVPFAAVLSVEHARDHRSPALAGADRRLDFGDTQVSIFEVP